MQRGGGAAVYGGEPAVLVDAENIVRLGAQVGAGEVDVARRIDAEGGHGSGTEALRRHTRLGRQIDDDFLAAVGPDAQALETTEEGYAVLGVDGDAPAAEGGREAGGAELAVGGNDVGVSGGIEHVDAATAIGGDARGNGQIGPGGGL